MDVILTFVAMAAAIGATVYVVGIALLKKKGAPPGELIRVADATVAYFRASDVDAKVDCVQVPGKGIVALVEVDPQVRFRSSYIIEQTLKEQILRITGKPLAEVYWRFPMIEKIADASHAGAAYAAMKTAKEDVHYDIGEASWDEYEKALSGAHHDKVKAEPG